MEELSKEGGSRFGKFLGKFEITLEGEQIELKPTLEHKQKLMALNNKYQKGVLTAEDYGKQDRIFIDIIQTSYPDLTVAEIETLLLKKGMDIMFELYIAFGWMKREDLEKAKKNLEKKMSDMTEN